MEKQMVVLMVMVVCLGFAGCSSSVKVSQPKRNLLGSEVFGVPVEKDRLGRLSGIQENEDGDHDIVSCVPYGSYHPMLDRMARSNASVTYLKAAGREKCIKRGGKTTCTVSGSVVHMLPKRRGIFDYQTSKGIWKKMYCKLFLKYWKSHLAE